MHSKKQVAEIAASIRQFGFANPLLIDVNSVLIAGHGWLLAAKSIGLDPVPAIMPPHLDEHKDARCPLPIRRLRSTQVGMWTS
jgi:ParB-like chromosome segregation protein Spo0J